MGLQVRTTGVAAHSSCHLEPPWARPNCSAFTGNQTCLPQATHQKASPPSDPRGSRSSLSLLVSLPGEFKRKQPRRRTSKLPHPLVERGEPCTSRPAPAKTGPPPPAGFREPLTAEGRRRPSTGHIRPPPLPPGLP